MQATVTFTLNSYFFSFVLTLLQEGIVWVLSFNKRYVSEPVYLREQGLF